MRAYRIVALAAALTLGLTAAYTITANASGPVTLSDLPGLGYSLSMQFNVQTGCGNYVVIGGNGVDHDILIGDLPPRCSTADEEQRRIDALLSEFPPPGAAPITTTVYGTTTELVTLPAVTLPAVTVTEPAVTLPAVTVASPPETHTVTQTVTVEAPPVVPLDPPWLVALAARSAGLNALYAL